MSTPRKNKNYNCYTSPYSKPIQQYASQNDEYISLEMGGRCQEGRDVTNSGIYGKKPNQRRANYSSGYYQNNNLKSGSGQKSWFTPRKNAEIGNSQSHTSSISLYLHPSMTEDPWSDLLARLECLNKSEITLKSQTKVEDTVDEGDKDELIVQ
uniref:Uncharacterized protein n=1 Tax=Musca domestica TaxID=7370 RepID=A0A1I8N835_MUSDO